MTWPAICVVIDAASRSMLAARKMLKRAQPSVEPVSSAMATTTGAHRKPVPAINVAPDSAKARAQASPIPVVEPVTSTALPLY